MNKSEAKIQQEIVQWYRNTYCLIHHNPRCMIFSIPNESSGPRAMQLIQTGLYPGVADLGIVHQKEITKYGVCDPILLFIECKAHGGVQSGKQIMFELHCEDMGIEYHIVRSLEEFKQVIENL